MLPIIFIGMLELNISTQRCLVAGQNWFYSIFRLHDQTELGKDSPIVFCQALNIKKKVLPYAKKHKRVWFCESNWTEISQGNTISLNKLLSASNIVLADSCVICYGSLQTVIFYSILFWEARKIWLPKHEFHVILFRKIINFKWRKWVNVCR
jgi:hypothetical protein